MTTKQYPPLTIKELSKLTTINTSTLRVYLNGRHFTDIKRNKKHSYHLYVGITDEHIKKLKYLLYRRTNPDISSILGGWNTPYTEVMEDYNYALEQ